MEEAQARGHEIYHIAPNDLSYDGEQVTAIASDLSVDLSSEQFMKVQNPKILPLSYFDAYFIRQEPIIDIRLITNLYLLEQAKSDT